MPPDSTTTPTTPQGKVWSRITTDDIEGRKFLVNLLGKDPLDNPAVSASESNEHVLLPIKLPLRQNGYYVETHLCLVLGKKWIATLEGEKRLSLLDRIEWDFAYDTSQDSPPSPFAVGLDILDALNAGANQTIDGILSALDQLAEEVQEATGGFQLTGRQPGVADIADTAISLAEAEELIANAVEGQLMLARALRWLDRFAAGHLDSEIRESLGQEIEGNKRQLLFLHEKIRSLQQSLLTTLDLKQNQVIKLFAVITVVFTPPTLVAAFYGQNFAHMPELAIPWMEWAVMAMIFLSAVVPLWYVQSKGWLR